MAKSIRRLLALALTAACLTALFPLSALAAPSYTEYDVYVERPASEAGNRFYHGVKYEPKTGSYLGMFAEGDALMHDWNKPDYTGWYFGGTPRYTGKEHAVYMVYVHYDADNAISNYTSHYKAAKTLGKAMQICVEPTNGLDEVKDDAHLRALAQQARDADIPIFLRFASEFNDDSGGNNWNKDGPAKFIEKFRLVADVFHAVAPNVVMVWAPNDWPIGSEDAYYPGDQYVDWIGVSSYQVFDADGIPCQKDTWMDRFQLLYEKYGTRKPVFITEGAAVPSVEYSPGQSVTESARYELLRFYAGAARRYPNLKMIIYWSENEQWAREIQCELTTNQTMLSAYKSAIADPYYLGSFNVSSDIYYQKASEATLRDHEKLSCYVNDVKNRVQRAVYYVNDTYVGEGTFPDYTCSVNLEAFAGQQVTLRADFYSEANAYLTSRSYDRTVKVSDPVAGFEDVSAAAYYADPVKWAVEKGITNGTSATTFAPFATCTRGQVVTFLWRAQGSPKVSAANPFTDVKPGDYYYDAVLWAVANHITSGTSDTTFSPSDGCTRAQVATFLWRTEGQQAAGGANPFSDVKEGDYYYNAVLWAVAKDITNGTSASTFSPGDTCTRGQIVTFLHRDMK